MLGQSIDQTKSKPGRAPWSSNGAARFALRFVLIGLVFYLALYFPYDEKSLPGRWLSAYVLLQARLAGGLIGLFDQSASVSGNLISGRYSLAIVLDCAAIDTQALFAATVLAFPAPWKRKLLGLAAGISTITVLNLGRIVALYLVGLHWPTYFKFLHEDLFQVLLVVAACASFAVWAWWARGGGNRVYATP